MLMGPMTLTPDEAERLQKLRYLKHLQYKAAILQAKDRPWFTGSPDHPDHLHRPARPEQLMPEGDWLTWLITAGRGFGKSRTGAEWCVDRALVVPGCLIAAIGKKWTQVRDVQITAIVQILERDKVRHVYNKGDLEITLGNGSVIRGYSAETPDTIRGANLWYAWLDELAHFPQANYLWHDCLIPAVRLGDPRILVTTTPKPTPLLKDLTRRDDGSVVLVRGSTWDNKDNLAGSVLAELTKRYEGTRTGRQELYGEIIEDTEGALWTMAMIEESRTAKSIEDILPLLATVAIGVDPAGRSSETSDETGIVVAANTGPSCPVCGGRDPRGHLVNIRDESGRYSPTEWARRAVSLYHEYKADYIVAEQNNGWDMVNATIQQVDRTVPIRKAQATRGKYVRAEPVSLLYTEGRAHHITVMPELEEQMTTYTPDARWSPDRMDAMVWAATYLMVRPQGPRIVVRTEDG